MVKSSKTGKFYATAKSCSIISTFDEETCKSLIGKQMPGRIVKVETEPYEYSIPNSDEVIELNFNYEYDPNGTVEETVLGDVPIA